MKNYNPNRPLISIHVPKCGGTSFINILQSWFKNRLYQHYAIEKENKKPLKAKIKGIFGYRRNICIHGHFNRNRGFGIEDYYPGETQLITFLRDPLEVALSTFFYNHKVKEKYGKFMHNGKELHLTNDIDEYLESSGSHICSFLPVDMNISNYKKIINERFIHIGTIEDFQKSIDTLADKLKKPRIKVHHANKSERFQQPSESSISVFKRKCVFEYELFSYATTLLNF